MTDTTQAKIIAAFQDLFRVWEGTNCSEVNATDVIEDACRTIGHQVYGLEGGKPLNEFVRRCKKQKGTVS